MSLPPRPTPPRETPVLRTTSDANLSLSEGVRRLGAGHVLDEMVGRSVLGLVRPQDAHGISTSWRGIRRIVDRLTKMGYYVQMQVHADRAFCEVLRVLDGAAVAKQLAFADGTALPETVAKAAVLACLEMQPQG
jgi:hypothetical protein